ncbi:MAG: Na(+)-translocating NADH-quinone reductase subunit A [Bacteroidota bacterium]
MKNVSQRLSIFFILLLAHVEVFAQGNYASGESWLTYGLVAIIAIIVLFFIVQVGDSFLSLEAQQLGVDQDKSNVSIFPTWKEIAGRRIPDHLKDKHLITLKEGHDILLEGEAELMIQEVRVKSFAVQPRDFVGMSPIPKVVVEVGDTVKAGDVLFYDKKRPDIQYVAPVSGEIAAINRAAKRAIAEVVILADETISYRQLDPPDLATADRTALLDFLLASGGWTMIRQRPYNMVPEPGDMPRDIFVSTFDSAPLAPNMNLVVEGQGAAFQKGIDVLNKLTEGKVYLGLDADNKSTPSSVFTNTIGAEQYYFEGKHPVGNVGVQIHNIKPLADDEMVWTLGVQEVLTLGKLFTEGRYDASRVVVLSGAEFIEPKYARTYLGANVGELVKGNIKSDGNDRLVSGDVLSGKAIGKENFLHFYDDQLTILEEGNDYELFGWLLPITPRPSLSNTYPNFLFPDQKFVANTNTHGERRAFVATNDYQQVMPMDIHVQPLMKAILVSDFERMEGLGIKELVEEDVALCEFACVSKMPLQKILRDGLDEIRAQG